MKTIIRENEIGYFIKNGIFNKILKAGKHTYHPFLGEEIIIVVATGSVDRKKIPLKSLLKDKNFSENTTYVSIPDGYVGIHYLDGTFFELLTKGEYLLWNVIKKHDIKVIKATGMLDIDDIPYKELLKDERFMENTFSVTIPNENIGIHYINDIFYETLTTGEYIFWNLVENHSVKTLKTIGKVDIKAIPYEVIKNDKKFIDSTFSVAIPDGNIGIHYINDIFYEILITGEYVFWNTSEKNNVKIVDIKEPVVSDDFPKNLFTYIPYNLFKKIEVKDGETALLYYDNKLEKELNTGTYYFWCYKTNVTFKIIDVKLKQFEINGQEILTADKVSIRLNIICNYKITDPVQLTNKISDLTQQIYVYTQLIIREYIGKYTLDEILSQKEEINKFISQKLCEKENEYFVEFKNIGIKDIILPGEIREIMNRVLIAEKTAQANVITRREEVASTRSLLNTAKLMDENKTLYKLKEMEYIEKICEGVGNISVSGNNSIIEQLSKILCSNDNNKNNN